MIKVALVDDDVTEREHLQEMFARLNDEIPQSLSVEPYESGEELLRAFDDSYQLLCLDIEFAADDPTQNGIELAKKIRRTNTTVMIIFITNLAQMAISGYEVRAFDFILKPLSYGDFAMKLKSAIGLLQERKSDTLQIHTPQGFQLLSTEDITYIEVDGHYITYHTFGSVYRVKGSLKDVEKEVFGLPFKRCNNCYLVNLKYVDSIDKEDVIVGGERLRMSRPKKREFLQAVSEYIGGRVV